MSSAAVHCQPSPGALAGFVFICPGRFEQARGYPCAAGTGANLARALVALNRRAPALFPSADRRDYVVTNAWSQVEYMALSDRSVPSEAEVLEEANLQRLAGEIDGLRTIVACGAQAHAALRRLVSQGSIVARVAYARHLSQRSVNMIPGGSTTDERIERWVEQVLAQLS
jgi:hypothetical protein